MPADPKGGKRIVDPKEVRAALMMYPYCAACGIRASNAHHVIQKGSPYFGDDVVGNIVGLCGTGTSRCHGAHHGSPYEVLTAETPNPFRARRGGSARLVERRDAEWVNRRIGATILERRADVVDYVLEKLGTGAGIDFLRRVYYVEVM